MSAGFDGVELHGANGYLIDQFLRANSNRRNDAYGGTPENRLRFLREVVSAVSGEAGAERVGVRLSPHVTLQDMEDPEMIGTSLLAAEALHEAGIAYLHIAEADWDDAPVVPLDYRQELRRRFPRTIIVAGRYTPERGEELMRQELADLVTFGRPFLANPDLPRRIAEGLPLNPPDPKTFFGGGAKGYDDYPFYGDALAG
jgi:N-ethylmaleimide reductase